MANKINRLTVKTIEHLKRPGYYHDGSGLYLQVSETGGKTWLYRYMLDGKARWMGLGAYRDVGLEAARTARDAQRAVLKGKERADPIALRNAQRKRSETASKTFDQCAHEYIEAHRAGWRNPKYAREWAATLKTYASPVFGKLPVQEVDFDLVLSVLEPIWRTKTETANRVRGRIEAVLDWAKVVKKFRTGENPARWRGNLDKALPKPSKVAPIQHRAAMPYADVPEFMRTLRTYNGMAVQALEFCILTAVRVSEAVGATWDEIDIEKRMWSISASRMKANKAHRVPLSDAALKVVKKMQTNRQNDYVFPGLRGDRPLTIAAPLKQLRDLGHSDLTVHGFRSSFRDWAGETTNFPREICEAALAHSIGNATEAAYQRRDLFDKRAKLMQAWSDYCDVPRTASITPIRTRQ